MDVKTESTTDYAAMADFLENLLMRQADKLRSYDLDGASAIAEQSAPIAEELTRHKVLNRPEFAERKRRLEQMYKDICLIISDQRQEVSDKLAQIRQGLHALGGYKGK
jgi:hypothetical protein